MLNIIRTAALSVAVAAAALAGTAATAPTANAAEGYTRPQWCKYQRSGWWFAPKHITIHGRNFSGFRRQCESNGLHLSGYRRVGWGWD